MRNLVIFLLMIFSAACSGEANMERAQMSMAAEDADFQEESEAQHFSDQKPLEPERKLIKTANIRFQVEDLEKSTEKIKALTQEYSGIITGMFQNNNHYSIRNNLTIRVPAADLDRFLDAVELESIYTEQKSITAQDVTEEFLDISTRLETKKAVRDRYISILREKAQSVKDILDAEEKIRVIQEEIESIEGRLKYINNRTSLSTVNVEIYQEVEYEAPPVAHGKSFFTKLKDGFLNGWDLILDLAVGLVSIWPILLILTLILVFRKRIKLFNRK
ncbi:DUF4349 domain-containing protein [Flavilitoribacter nigricans]|uniref:DUF4349 domain-containing protein n=1 Tax=Flavilitoribacter nigricans (strain ATCC 23147 / DSM 23189 / NBRC 102662 / NCIMB 1420 / SS-2) TaxID=1122177 RepID=A0A2D0MX37_FLAN2|nr:DUF4349 domain-containing protein [Flavilitoribacter nigricans]PHN00696.1 hypothetical protein CRP01_40955 [Flavilitoribacter nigricans DSM 23189 = NBRC 102662]